MCCKWNDATTTIPVSTSQWSKTNQSADEQQAQAYGRTSRISTKSKGAGFPEQFTNQQLAH